jgi:hypothetical protein
MSQRPASKEIATELAARPWITAGVALVGAGVVIVTPVLSLLLAGTLPPSVDITSLDLVLGGLLSPAARCSMALALPSAVFL